MKMIILHAAGVNLSQCFRQWVTLSPSKVHVENKAISWQTQSKAGGLVKENNGSPFVSGVFS